MSPGVVEVSGLYFEEVVPVNLFFSRQDLGRFQSGLLVAFFVSGQTLGRIFTLDIA